jgi:hypothetical protein
MCVRQSVPVGKHLTLLCLSATSAERNSGWCVRSLDRAMHPSHLILPPLGHIFSPHALGQASKRVSGMKRRASMKIYLERTLCLIRLIDASLACHRVEISNQSAQLTRINWDFITARTERVAWIQQTRNQYPRLMALFYTGQTLTRQEFHNESDLSSAYFRILIPRPIRLAAQIVFSEHANKLWLSILDDNTCWFNW